MSDSFNMGSGGSLTGDGVIVGVMDSGLDSAVECYGISSCTTLNSGIHSDFSGRIAGVVNYGSTNCDSYSGFGKSNPCTWQWWEDETLITTIDDTNTPSDYQGHGTHVAGSVLGDGGNSPDGADNSGMAPEAHLFMQSVGWGCRYTDADGNNKPESTRCDARLATPNYAVSLARPIQPELGFIQTHGERAQMKPEVVLPQPPLAGIITQQILP